MGSTPYMDRMVGFLTGTDLGQIPEDVRADGRLSLLDTIGCMVGGSSAPAFRSLASRYLGAIGASPVLGTDWRVPAPYAALLGGIAATWLDLDSGHRHPSSDPPIPGGHPPAHNIPVMLAEGEPAGIDGETFLRTHLLTYELGARLGVATRLRSGLHVHGVQFTVGAAAAAAVLRGADALRIEAAMRLGAGLSIMPTMQAALDGGTVRNTFAAIGAFNGVLANHLLDTGVEPESRPFETVYGTVASTGFDPELFVDRLGEHWETTLGYYKVHACCRWNHPALDALEEVILQHPIAYEDVDRVEVRTFAFAAQMDDREPPTDLGAKFSIPFAVAACLVLGGTGYRSFTPDAVQDERIRRLALAVSVREEPEFSAALPARRPTAVDVHLSDGSVLSATVPGSRGDPGDRFPVDRMHAKFLELVGDVVGEAKARRALEMLNEIERLTDIRMLVAELTTGGAGE
jgi:2-methylcitrate dehydratase PrpD